MSDSTPRLIDLWRHATLRCQLSRTGDGPPFVVRIYDGERLVSEQTFETHDEAAAFAVAALGRATTTGT